MKSDCSGFLEKYLDSERIFVFPSEIAAYEWAAYALKNGNRTAVDRDRFISWDTFKEQCFQLFQKEKPVNRTLRSLYAAHLLDKNRKEKFLEWFVRPEHAELSLNFRKTVESVLMSFNSAGQLLKSPLPAELKKDLSLLYERYSLFLKKHGLFEPSGIRPEIDTAGKKYLIIVPDIISDFEEYRTLLEKEKDIDFNFFPEPENTVLYEFRTVSREHRYIAEGFEKMLKNDPQASLAVSCTSETEQGYQCRVCRCVSDSQPAS